MIKSRKPAAGEFTLFRRRRASAGRRIVAVLAFVVAAGMIGLAAMLALPGAPLSSAAADLLGADPTAAPPAPAAPLPGPESGVTNPTDKPGQGGKPDKPGQGGKPDKPCQGAKPDKPGGAGKGKPLPPVQVPSVSVPAPTSITIDRLGIVEERPTGLQVTEDQLEVPEDYADIGWWSDGPTPGSTGAAVVVGHLDSPTGPAVFYELGLLAEGDSIVVTRADRSTATFKVEEVRSYAREDFPSERVYRQDGRAALHLLTCGGEYDTVTGQYTENVVVYASLVDLDEPDRRHASERQQRGGRRS